MYVVIEYLAGQLASNYPDGKIPKDVEILSLEEFEK